MQIIIVYVLDVYIITICYVNMVSSEFNFTAPSPIMSNYEDFIEFRKFIYNTIIDFVNINEQLVTTFMDSYVTIHIYVWQCFSDILHEINIGFIRPLHSLLQNITFFIYDLICYEYFCYCMKHFKYQTYWHTYVIKMIGHKSCHRI